MNRSKMLGLLMLAPALFFVILLFFMPVILTGFFAFTNMSTATGIGGGSYQLTESALDTLNYQYHMPGLVQQLQKRHYKVDKAGIAALKGQGLDPAFVLAIESNLLGKSFTSRDELLSQLRYLPNAPFAVYQLINVAQQFQLSVGANRYGSKAAFFKAIHNAGIELTAVQREALTKVSYTGWVWTTDNFKNLWHSPDTANSLMITLGYVFTTLILFNVGFALLLALATHYMPDRIGGIYRGIWILPRITPPVLYVLLWKWLAWDTGFISRLLGLFGIPSQNWMMGSATNAWVFIVLINGFVGASMGMLVLSSAIKGIPKPLFWATEIDGASRWQQIRYLILPQLRWPILFIACYQTLSLLSSFEYILLATDGGPGSTTQVWSLMAYHQALHNYAGNLQYGLGAAMTLVLVVIGVVLSLLYLRLFGFTKMVDKPRIEI